ncbi:extradiol ring-cleavage dioxygenase [Pseudonocardia kujensis]|uniref:DODA-type extradiol aromatic ring-opening family dioxygenase n=1 Tax=Pseudonocardia kujensis TaxID=1128675 RepID=UPI001E50DD2B|nr:extradiol ring-cleavage dioxygenase [Pseudonocardia kujensis]MCE0767740.1 extradiol ring-cleavage dioxygenase [Pseudonocardia kujensis]
MGEILGLGVTHYPPLAGSDDDMAWVIRKALQDPLVPDHAKDVSTWPALMREEWGEDEGRTSARRHRARLVAGLDRCRAELDSFAPDVVVIWGDDQYENFREDIIPPYAVLAYDDMTIRPWADLAHSSGMLGRSNYWQEGPDAEISIKGHPEVARWLAKELLDKGIDVSYAYRPLHHDGMAHAFLNTILYLDYHRRGFPYPVIQFPLNCYGSKVIGDKGFVVSLGDAAPLDPPSPPPWRFMEVGAAVAKAFAASDLKVALIASSSWSHAFTTDKTWRLQPDVEADRVLYQALVEGDFDVWRARSLAEVEDSGQQELLNWHTLLGAMESLGRKAPDWSSFEESYIFNSSKAFAVYRA